MSYIIGFDIGNTNTTLGIYCENETAPLRTFRYRTEKGITTDELSLQVEAFIKIFNNSISNEIDIAGIAFSSVVPEIDRLYKEISKRCYGLSPLEIGCDLNLGLRIRYDNPEQLGADRITNAVAAFYEHDRDCIIVDLGTATTFCVLHKSGIFDGGLIGPGIGITIEALMNKTSRLKAVNFERVDKIIARNTTDAIKSGFYFGWLSMIEGILDRIEGHYNKNFLIIITGGYSEIIGKNISKTSIADSLLTMKGIKYIYDLNSHR
ncbi:MAG: type III pantothenate kinase [Spirochaetota bacterium]|nr:type III pantothenate kinase [Spirochaetota bacterium]